MSDIVDRLKATGEERLRASAHQDPPNYLSVVAKISQEDGALMTKSADEIKRLRSALTGILNEWEERDEGPTLPFVLGLTMAGIARAALEGTDDAPSHPHA